MGDTVTQECVIFAGFAVLMSLITVLPDLWAAFNDPKQWVPVNSPPYELSDDYHYFSLLNLVHRWLLNVLGGKKLDVIPFGAFSRYQIVGHLFNIFPYHVGYVLHDRRLGILLVRVWNMFWLMLALATCAKLLLNAMRIENAIALPILVAMIYYVTYPALISAGARGAILPNLLRRRHIFSWAQPNDLHRALHMATTGHMLLWSVALLFWSFTQPFDNAWIYLIPGGMGVMLFLTYFPAAAVYALLYSILLVLNGLIAIAVLWLVVSGTLTLAYLRASLGDRVGRELFAHGGAKGYFLFSRRRVVLAAGALLLALACYVALQGRGVSQDFWAIFFGATLFVFTNFLAKHQGSRFWDRGALVVYQLCVVVSLLALVDAHVARFSASEGLLVIASVTLPLCVYFVRNASFLLAVGSKRAPPWIDIAKLSSSRSRSSRLIVTDSVEIGFYVYLYTGDSSLLRSYSFQNAGYRKNLEYFCLNFKLAGYQLEDMLALFSCNVRYADWLPGRIDGMRDPRAAALANLHTLQYMATIREFNQALLDDGMFDESGWTPRARELVSRIWIELAPCALLPTTVIMSPNGGLRAALQRVKNGELGAKVQEGGDD